MRPVEIPVSVVGEVGGFVLDSTANGFGGIRIQLLDGEQRLVKQLISEPDGFFSYLGMKSGTYTARLYFDSWKSWIWNQMVPSALKTAIPKK